MTTPTEAFVHEDFYRSARPIRRFVAGVLAIAVLLLLAWWTGLVNSRVSATVTEWTHDPVNDLATVRLEVRNEAPLGLHLEDLANDVVVLRSATLDGQPTGGSPHLPGTGTAELVVAFEAPGGCRAHPGSGTTLTLRLRTASGLVRDERVWLPSPC